MQGRDGRRRLERRGLWVWPGGIAFNAAFSADFVAGHSLDLGVLRADGVARSHGNAPADCPSDGGPEADTSTHRAASVHRDAAFDADPESAASCQPAGPPRFTDRQRYRLDLRHGRPRR